MHRSRWLAGLGLAFALNAAAQEPGVLHIRISLVDPERGEIPVPNHALLISDNPATAAPRLVRTGVDGTATVRLRPGNYTVESDRPVAFHGKSYQWTETLDVVAGRDAVLALTADNAESGTAAPEPSGVTPPLEADPAFLLPRWQDSVVAIWTPLEHASGFLVDRRGVIATSQRAIGTATRAEVQLAPGVKIAGVVVASDPARDVALIRIDPAAVASLQPVPLACDAAPPRPLSVGQAIFTIVSPLNQQKDMTSGTVGRIDPRTFVSDLELARGAAGSPVFSADGTLVGLTSTIGDDMDRRSEETRVVRADAACDVMASAERKLAGVAPPDGRHLPVEPDWPIPVDALKETARGRAGSLNPYQVAFSGFDVSFITPVMTYGAEYQSLQAGRRGDGSVHPLMDFSNWSVYVDAFPPVLLIRATPKQVEGFWTTVARGAAQTQGVSIPSIRHFSGSFAGLRAFCGAAEVTPIHPFKLERRVTDTDVVYEGLYAFDPDALGPQCGTVRIAVTSEKEPDKEDSRVVDPKVILQVQQDFAPYRTPPR